jgi:ribosomal protein S18 acetylase RimI-like enzyme
MAFVALVRPALAKDLGTISRFAGELVRMHHRFDAKRFMLIDNVEAGYEWFFRRELGNKEVAILTAEREGELLGYAYGRLEPRDWNNLLDVHGAVHDLFVAPAARRQGVGRALLSAMLAALGERGARTVVLFTATPNVAAQRLFEMAGFRSTMIEMTRELE